MGNSTGNSTGNIVGNLVGNAVENLVENSAGEAAGNPVGNSVGNFAGNLAGNLVRNSGYDLALLAIIGSKGAPGTCPPPGVQILSLSYSFRQKVEKIIPIWKLAHPLGKILDPPHHCLQVVIDHRNYK